MLSENICSDQDIRLKSKRYSLKDVAFCLKKLYDADKRFRFLLHPLQTIWQSSSRLKYFD